MQNTSTITDFKLLSNFERLRNRLLGAQFADRLEKPLAHWALPNDRRLPLAFMGRTLKDLLDTPFEDLYATPGVGQKKLNSLLVLLTRAANGSPPEDDNHIEQHAASTGQALTLREVDLENIDPQEVSEDVWAEWCDCIVRTGFEHLPLGRYAPSLERLPRVLWDTPLSTYTGLTLGQIRQLKTHGEKRVAALIEVFGALYRILKSLDPQPDLAVRIVPRIVNELEEWIDTVNQRGSAPESTEIYHRFTHPLLVQLRIDGGTEYEQLAKRRLGLTPGEASVREVATEMGLTRARIYQLLGDISEMMRVRWPEGPRRVRTFLKFLRENNPHESDLTSLEAAADLFFPSSGVVVEEDLN